MCGAKGYVFFSRFGFFQPFWFTRWVAPPKMFCNWYCWFSDDVTKIQITKLWILPRFHFHGVLEQLNTNFQTNFRSKRFLGFVVEYA